ncbi:Cytochrome P450 monooxygenase 151 [Psilocybe cubensis]|uniref:Cytochrome P450 monooxygenase 151 n=2 Tax=Psilocybe cubensis TaxID=181762 RepID=A0ACB8H4E3_PSICU|nr:Cytochrome P450 monooxygenase 151 [Psilocybe cubensis]KAH9482089.1 Cytochrome P450 monooxygenase 151 [Psilocybe cubensis]
MGYIILPYDPASYLQVFMLSFNTSDYWVVIIVLVSCRILFRDRRVSMLMEHNLRSIKTYSLYQYAQLDHIPTIGYSTPFLSFISAVKFFLSGREIVEEGYRKARQYPGGVWKLPMFDEWLVVANGRERVEDIRKANESQLSGVRSNPVFYQWDHTLGVDVSDNPYHINIVRGPLTRNLANQFNDIHDEMVLALNDMIPCKADEWTSVPVFEGLVEVISRITTRAFLGIDLCRNNEFRKLCIQSTMELVKGRFLHLFPVFLRPTVGRFVTNVDAVLSGIEKHLAPIIAYRLEQDRVHGGEWADKPADLITWLLDSAKATGEEPTPRNMAKRVVVFSFASTYSSAVAFAQALYELCDRPEYVQPLREEALSVMRHIGHGKWTKAAVGEMYKTDSFLRETQRYNGLGLVLLSRRVLKPFTFSDVQGTTLPPGTHLCVNAWGNHRDDTYYHDPPANVFDGFRFSRITTSVSENGGSEHKDHQQPLMATPTLEYNAFGHGRPACPGRFFAVAELKLMLGYILTTYNFRFSPEAARQKPQMAWFESKVIPDKSVRLLFQRRPISYAVQNGGVDDP